MRLKVLLRSSRNAGQPEPDDKLILVPEELDRLERIAVMKEAPCFNKQTQTEGLQRADVLPPPPLAQWAVLPTHALPQPAQQAMTPPPLAHRAVHPATHRASHPTTLRAIRPRALWVKPTPPQQLQAIPLPPPVLPPINSGIYTEDEFRKYWGIQRGPDLSNVTKDMLEVADILAEYGKTI